MRAQIFGTTFEITSRCVRCTEEKRWRMMSTDAREGTLIFSLWEWELLASCGKDGRTDKAYGIPDADATQLGERSTHESSCRDQEDHEAFQHAGPIKANIQGVEAAETSSTRECTRPFSFQRCRCCTDSKRFEGHQSQRHLHLTFGGHVRSPGIATTCMTLICSQLLRHRVTRH